MRGRKSQAGVLPEGPGRDCYSLEQKLSTWREKEIECLVTDGILVVIVTLRELR